MEAYQRAPEVMESEMSEGEGSFSPSAPPRRSSSTGLRTRSPPRYDAVLAVDPQAREAASAFRGRRAFGESLGHAGETGLIRFRSAPAVL